MRLIDADKVEGIFKGACKTGYFDNKPKEKNGVSAFMDCIRELDTIDPESLICSNCGAKMDLREGEANGRKAM